MIVSIFNDFKGKIYKNLSVDELYSYALSKKEGVLSHNGTLVVTTGKYTGRSPKDRFIVDTPDISGLIDWDEVNLSMSEEKFDILYNHVIDYVNSLNELFVFDGFAGSCKNNRLNLKVINEFASQNLFMHQMLKRPNAEELQNFKEELTVIAVPGCKADLVKHGTNTEAFIVINFLKKLVLIGGSKYCGEQKKAVFTYLNSHLPQRNIFPMHCSANMDKNGNTAVFFGLSGTGKTTLSTSPDRKLIGDDEHGWSENGIFNFEGGCYAKCIDLKEEKEPNIYRAIKKGAIVENVIMDKEGNFDFNDDSLTKNTRVAFPIEYIPCAILDGSGNHPKTIIFLMADAFGVMPPIAKLGAKSASYYFLSGYTSKLAGTETGIVDPVAVFSSYFGKPFMPLKPKVYSCLFQKYISKYNPSIFLINTGWIGGPYGVGNRIDIMVTRTMVKAALNDDLNNVEYNNGLI